VVKKGDEVRIEPTGKVAVELFGQQDARDYFLEEVPQTPWSNIGGQDEAIKMIRETIELPLLHPELFAKFEKKPIKGVLLYGPPGCGKTLIGKAIAYNLAKEYSERLGREVKEYFLNISGPKILNMWLGESERMVREIFDTARTKAKEGNLVVIFIDEAESILRTRSSGRYMNISNTVVPQFCAEMDGVMGLENVIVVLTSNRPDYIDPAILRPERIDRKVKITRPDLNSAKSILSIYLNENLPIDPVLVKEFDNEPACARKELIESTMTYLFRKEKATEFLKVSLRNGSNETLYFKDLLSGALLKSLVDRAKDTAITRAIENPKTEQGLSKEDMQAAIDAEFSENEIFPKNDVVEDWLKLIDFDIENVVNVRPVKTTKGEAFVRKNIL
jgi:proteasome-associated ATPase